jgi:hypothetical protein
MTPEEATKRLFEAVQFGIHNQTKAGLDAGANPTAGEPAYSGY